MIWFTSDWHLGHVNIIKYSKRPFKDIYEQRDTIFQNFFTRVKDGDTVYYLGDIAFGASYLEEFICEFKKRYHNVQFHYIEGNHDRKLTSNIKRFATSYHKVFDFEVLGQPITLMHYIMYSFNKSHFNAWQLYGHHHDMIVNTTSLGKRMCVCLELNNYAPVSMDQVKCWMDAQPNNWDYLTKNGRSVDACHTITETA